MAAISSINNNRAQVAKYYFNNIAHEKAPKIGAL
jgi:hypothetical protein